MKVIVIYQEKNFDIAVDSSPTRTSSQVPSPASTSAVIDEVVIGFDDEAKKIIDRLTRGTKCRDIVAIVGMPGLGKTTLAKKVYNDISVMRYFSARAWCCVSQVYERRELLLKLLSDVAELPEKISKMSDDDIAELLRKRLKRKKYLIVMDDLWSIAAWNDLEPSFPDDKNESRVLFTSRLHNVASQAKTGCNPHPLRALTDDECFNLLQGKLFPGESCPPTLLEVGKDIARNCKGLPLSVVVIAGLLSRTKMTVEWWTEVSKSLISQISLDPQNECMRILELSYQHLPDRLKSCFLYFGLFPEDKEVPTSKLLRLWTAEGFPQRTSGADQSLEDAAEADLLDLIGRSLVEVTKRGSNGRIKSCRLHDLLRDLCLETAKEENFFELIGRPDDDYLSLSNRILYQSRRLCICSNLNQPSLLNFHGSHVRCLSTYTYDCVNLQDMEVIPQNFKLLRVLDLEFINLHSSFPTGLELLFLLKFLSIRCEWRSVPASLANLRNLETFIMKGLRGEIRLPDSFWNVKWLRHVHINDRFAFALQDNELERSFFEKKNYKPESASLLQNMDSLSTPALSYGGDTERMLRRFPRLRKLRCIFLESWDNIRKCNMFPTLSFLSHLESLKIFYHGMVRYPCQFNFPSNIKKITLSKFCLPWSEMSTFGKLGSLEILKLRFKAFEGKRWEMRDGEFPNLKYLELDGLDVAQWDASSDHLPSLEHLVLQKCKKLEEVPSEFGDIPTLRKIEMRGCSHSAVVSVTKIQEQQLEFGNEELKVIISAVEE